MDTWVRTRNRVGGNLWEWFPPYLSESQGSSTVLEFGSWTPPIPVTTERPWIRDGRSELVSNAGGHARQRSIEADAHFVATAVYVRSHESSGRSLQDRDAENH